MVPVKIKARKYGTAIGMLLRMGGGFQTRFERTLIVNAEQLRLLKDAGLVDPKGFTSKPRANHGQKAR